MKMIVNIAIVAATLMSASAFAEGMVGGQLKSQVRLDTVTQKNKATGVGYARQELNVGSVNGGKALGNVDLNVQMKSISQDNQATGVGYARQEANIGSLK